MRGFPQLSGERASTARCKHVLDAPFPFDRDGDAHINHDGRLSGLGVDHAAAEADQGVERRGGPRDRPAGPDMRIHRDPVDRRQAADSSWRW